MEESCVNSRPSWLVLRKMSRFLQEWSLLRIHLDTTIYREEEPSVTGLTQTWVFAFVKGMTEMDNEKETHKPLYRLGGAACLAIALLYLSAIAVYVPAMRQGPAPTTVLEWFDLLQNNRLVGLFYLGLADIPIVILFSLVALALHAALKQTDKVWTTIAAPLAFVGMAVYLATNVSFSMLALSGEYAAATTEVQRTAILAAGHSLISVTHGTGGVAGLALVWLAALIYSILMLRDRKMGGSIAWIGILAFGLLVPSFLFSGYTYGASSGIGEALALITSLGGGLLSLVWYILMGIKLVRMSRA